MLSETSSITRSSATHRLRKGWKRYDFLQQKAQEGGLNTSCKWRGETHHEIITEKIGAKCNPCKKPLAANRSSKLHGHVNEKKQTYHLSKSISSVEKTSGVAEGIEHVSHERKCKKASDSECLLNHAEDDRSGLEKGYCGKDCSCIDAVSVSLGKEYDCECDSEHNASSASPLNQVDKQDEDSSSEASKNVPKSKRHSDRDLDNPKPRKCRRPFDGCINLSCKYSAQSFCSSNDCLPDGFYDPGRDRPFMPLQHFMQSLCLESREVILVDRFVFHMQFNNEFL